MEETAIITTNRNVQLGAMTVDGPSAVIDSASAIASQLANIIDTRHLYRKISNKKYVYVEGWSTMGGMLGVVPQEKEVKFTKDDDGYEEYESTVELVRVSDGAVVGRASAIVGTDEKTWGNRPRYARRSMATTRATGKAFRLGFSWIMQLAGYAVTPAEEMDGVVDAEYRDPQPRNTPLKPRNGNGDRPLSPDTLADMLNKKAVSYNGQEASKAQRGLCAGMLSAIFEAEVDKHAVQEFLFGATSLNDVTDEQVLAALDWLKPEKDSGGAYKPDVMASNEALATLRHVLQAEGQQELL